MSLPAEMIKSIERLIPRYPEKRGALIPALHFIQKEYRYVPEESMRELSELLDVSFVEVRRVASFYSMFSLKPHGRHTVHFCKTLSCRLNNAHELLKSISKHFNLAVGETSNDGAFTLLTTECLAACDRAPNMLVDEKLYTGLDEKKAIEIIEGLK